MDGWTKIYRKVLENPIVCKDSDYFAVWMYLLLNATHSGINTEFNGSAITLKEGQLITGRKVIAERFKINETKVQRILTRLEKEHQIEQQTSNRNRLITVVNWSKYQDSEQQNEQQVNNRCTTDEQQVNTNKNVRKKECKKGNIYTCDFETFWKVYPRKQDKANAYKKYKARLNDGYSEEELAKAARKYSEQCRQQGTEMQYIKLGKTFLSDSTPFIDFLEKPEEEQEEKKLTVSEKYANLLKGGIKKC